ncbi:ATP synthase F1 subunit epsilon [Culicoidibacter larvae]|uniref:ATP synthase epsilon chain n=1 Tax=Culicoidibacter larvae TaxID=2579976 RepID=A0A5R8QI39_9FIRM|nr:ATP synthase F1 subunit epsilon [Culicoidibacter larvae]TLG77093.1 ATP synthase F1 subunit epsilon [Culicoidibacter larvae]
MADKSLHLQIIALDRILYDGQITKLTINSTGGELTILPNHMPIVAVIEPAPIYVHEEDGNERIVVIHGGYFNLFDNDLLVVADDAIFAEEIDRAREEEAVKEAEHDINETRGDNLQLARAKVRLQRSLMNLQVADSLSKLK